MADKTAAERAIEEPRRIAGESGFNVLSNYYFCPTLCRDCKYFYKENSNWPYHCKGPSQLAASHKSKKEGFKQYDDCHHYEKEDNKTIKEVYNPLENIFSKTEEKAVKNRNLSFTEEELSPSERRRLEREARERETEEREQKREEKEREEWEAYEKELEFKRTHCFICKKEGVFVDFHGEKFHQPCLDKFKETVEGKKWISEKEITEEKEHVINENTSKIFNMKIEYDKKYGDILENAFYKDLYREYKGKKNYDDSIFLNIDNTDLDNFAQFLEKRYQTAKEKKEEIEKARKEQEEKERQEKEAERQLEEKKQLQRKIKLPVFIIGTIITLFFNNTLFLTLDELMMGKFIPIIALFIALLVYNGILTGLINSCYDLIREKTKEGYIFTKIYKFYYYAIIVIFGTIIHGIILFLIMRLLLKIW